MEEARRVVIVGAGPAGLIAADALSASGVSVEIHDQMPSPARKFLMAGRGGLNLTHSEDKASFLRRYGEGDTLITKAVEAFPPPALRHWCAGLGEQTFVGSSGRVFPKSFKASPLLRALLRRLESRGVLLQSRSRLTQIAPDGDLLFQTAAEPRQVRPAATLLALGGYTWPRLGSDGSWVDLLQARGITIAPLRPFNAGITLGWSPFLREKFAGTPLKPLALMISGKTFRGEAILTQTGLEGGVIYAAGAEFAQAIAAGKPVLLSLDLAPDLSLAALTQRLEKGRKGQSQSTLLARAGLKPVAIALLREAGPLPTGPLALAGRIKALSLPVTGHADAARAISTGGGVHLSQMNDDLMVRAVPGLFLAGEMLDWQAPTGGYLLQACFATGLMAARGICRHLGLEPPDLTPFDWS